MNNQTHSRILYVLQVACFLIFIGRAYQYIFWDAPFRTLLWDESLLKGVIEGLTSMSWGQYVTHRQTDDFINWLIGLNGVFFICCAIVCLLIRKVDRIWGYTLLVGSFALAFLAFLYTKEKFFHIGQFFEYSIQFTAPIILYLYRFTTLSRARIMLLAQVAAALTFICHGLYAVGYYPRPGAFVDMTINTLHISEQSAHTFLIIMGVLDFIVALTIFIPVHKVRYAALYYMATWGLLTAAARLTSNIYFDFFWSSLHQSWYEFAIRVPHALIPLVIILIVRHHLAPSNQMINVPPLRG